MGNMKIMINKVASIITALSIILSGCEGAKEVLDKNWDKNAVMRRDRSIGQIAGFTEETMQSASHVTGFPPVENSEEESFTRLLKEVDEKRRQDLKKLDVSQRKILMALPFTIQEVLINVSKSNIAELLNNLDIEKVNAFGDRLVRNIGTKQMFKLFTDKDISFQACKMIYLMPLLIMGIKPEDLEDFLNNRLQIDKNIEKVKVFDDFVLSKIGQEAAVVLISDDRISLKACELISTPRLTWLLEGIKPEDLEDFLNNKLKIDKNIEKFKQFMFGVARTNKIKNEVIIALATDDRISVKACNKIDRGVHELLKGVSTDKVIDFVIGLDLDRD
jgi:hypothetical protein